MSSSAGANLGASTLHQPTPPTPARQGPESKETSALGLLSMAALYATFGGLGLALAVPPGYASPLFPAAGLALALALQYGTRTLPAVWLGSFLLNSAVALANGNASWRNLLLAASIGAGAALQAWLGQRLVRWRLAKSWQQLDHEGQLLMFLGLGGTAACVAGATIGVSSLLAAGLAPPSEFGYLWWSWYIGDTLGVFTCAPLFIGFLRRHDGFWPARLRASAPAVVGTLVVVGALFLGAARWEDQDQRATLEEHAKDLAESLEASAIAHRELLASLAHLVEVNPDIQLDQFAHFTRASLSDRGDLSALSFNPYITLQGRAEFERRMARLYPDGADTITERDPQRRVVPAGTRPDYVPVGIISPLEGNRAAIGFDINSEPIRRDAIARARKSGRPAATAPVRLVQEQQERPGVLVLVPAFKRTPAVQGQGEPGELMGFAVGVIKIDELIATTVAAKLSPSLILEIEDAKASGPSRHLYRTSTAEPAARSGLVAERTVLMADRPWKLRLLPTQAYLAAHRPWVAWVLGVVGLLLTAMLQIILLAATGRTALIQLRVKEQTEEIRTKSDELVKSEARFRLVSELAQEAIWDVDLQTGRMQHNRNFNQILGLGDDLTERPLGEFLERIHPDDQARRAKAFEHAVQNDVDFASTYRVCHRDGHDVWVEDSARVVSRDAAGQAVRVLGAFVDVTEQLLAQKALSEANARLRLSLDTAQMAWYEADPASQTAVCDERTFALWGVAPDQRSNPLPLRSLLQRVHPDDRTWVSERIVEVLRSQSDVALEFRLLHDDGEVYHVGQNARLVPGADGQPPKIVCVAHDITERKRYEAELIRAKEDALAGTRAKSEFLSTISHEIRTPLNGVMGGLQMLELLGVSPQAHPYLAAGLESSKLLLNVLNDVLDFSKIEAGRLDLDPTPTRLTATLHTVEQTFQTVPRDPGVALTFACDADLDRPLLVDDMRLRQVMTNLINNALKFTHHGQVEVSAKALARRGNSVSVEVSVHDTGIGMSPEVLAKLFTPFSQADGSLTRRYGGSGLGLSICKRLVEAMGGVIRVDSKVGEGSTFTVALDLPLADLPTASATWSPPADHASAEPRSKGPTAPDAGAAAAVARPLANCRVLVVDDVSTNRLVARALLEHYGATVYEADNGSQAVSMLRDQAVPADLVLMDLQMPVMGGLEATRLLRASGQPGLESLPVVAMTGNVATSDRDEAMSAGMSGVIAKPLTKAALLGLKDTFGLGS